MNKSSKLNQAILYICDHAGMYDRFEIAWVLTWEHKPHDPQQLRDAVRQLRRQGLLHRPARGVYQWTDAARTA